jgi:copper chaperone CopZ
MRIEIAGMHCQACVARVRKALEKLEGAQVREVEIGSANVDIDPARQAAALEAIEKAGYQPHVSA